MRLSLIFQFFLALVFAMEAEVSFEADSDASSIVAKGRQPLLFIVDDPNDVCCFH